MQSRSPVYRQSTRADQFGKLTRGAAPGQVHLKESILRVQEARGSRHVFARGAADGRDAKRISCDRDRLMQARDVDPSIEDRQAVVELSAKPPPAGAAAAGSQQQDDRDRPCGVPTHNVHLNDADENAVR